MRVIIIIGICVYILGVQSKPQNFKNIKKNCGYDSCHPVKKGSLNVHLIPHSHDDVGWLKTVDQYYFGSRNDIQFAGVQHIISSVVDSLRSHPDRRFIQVESAFFWAWWKKQTEEIRSVVQELVDSGRLEIINGAWSMNDEAAAHYHSIIDQFTWGLRIVDDTLGECGRPKIGWQIDPFGHSNEMASIFSQLGYEAMFFARLDYRDNNLRHNTSTLETIWQGSQELGDKSNIFTGVIYDFYGTPAGFCWDVLCGDTPINDDEESPDFNQDTIVKKFADYVTKGASYYRTNNFLVTMGGDFTYQAAEMFYSNMDKLIEGFKKYQPDINILYSTPSCYLKAVNDEAASSKISFPLKTDDFFPYASGTHSYWTGYFTSRPNSKRFERQGNNLLQVTKQLVTFEKLFSGKDYSEDLTLLKEAMGIMQHHDAITGTEKQHVADDYVRILNKAVKKAESQITSIISDLTKDTELDLENVKLESCLMSNVSQCEGSSGDNFIATVYNPLSRPVTHYVRLPVNGDNYKVTGPDGEDIECDVTPSLIPSQGANSDLVFPAANIPALGLKYFYIEKVDGVASTKKIPKKTRVEKDEIAVEIDDTTGLLTSVTINGVTLPIKQEFVYYLGANGTNFEEIERASGAYIFRPDPDNPNAIPISQKAKVNIYQGNIVAEIHQEFNDWVKQVIRIYKDEDFVEFDWMVGPIEIIKQLGVEVVNRFTTDLKTDKTFYTDSNGRHMVKRIRNYRETYEYTNEEPVSGNYYPVVSRISLKDTSKNIEVGLLNDRAQGGSSLQDGQLELMVHRRLLNDDAFGVGEALNELENGEGVVVRGTHYLVVGNIQADTGKSSAAIQRKLAQRKLLSPWTFVGDTSSNKQTFKKLKENFKLKFNGLTRALPDNVQILTLEPWSNDNILLRLEHIFESNEDPELSSPAEVDLENLFTLFDIVSVQEMTLGANQLIEENEKMSWNIENKNSVPKLGTNTLNGAKALTVTLNPMEIRTFILTVEAKK